MAGRTDLETLTYAIEAKVDKLSKQMGDALKIVDRGSTDIEKRLKEAGDKGGQALNGQMRTQVMELEHIMRSAWDSLASGASPTRVISQEGGRLAQVLGNGGLGGALKGITMMFPPVVMGVAAMGAAIYALASAEIAFEAEHRKTLIALMGTAAASGLTVQSLEDIVNATDKLNHQSSVATRSMALMFAGHGVEGVENIKNATAITEDLAVSLGIKVPAAAEMLAKALQHPQQGVKTLNEAVHGFVSGEQMRLIENLSAEGNELEAQKVLLDALTNSVRGNADMMSGWAKMIRDVGNAFAEAAHGAGEFMAHLFGYHGQDELNSMRAQMASLKKLAEDPKAGRIAQDNARAQMGALQATMAPLEARQREIDARGNRFQANVEDQHLQEAKDRADPQRARITQLTADVDRLKKAIEDDKRAGRDTKEDEAYLRGAQTNLARAKRRENHMPGERTVSDTTDAENRAAQQELDAATKTLAAAQVGLTKDIEKRRTAEIAVIEANFAEQRDKLRAKAKEIEASKGDRNKTAQLIELANAEAKLDQTRQIREKIANEKMAEERENAARAIREEIDRSEITVLQAKLQSAKTESERVKIQLLLLAAEKKELDAKMAAARKAALEKDPTNAAQINRSYDTLQRNQNLAYFSRQMAVGAQSRGTRYQDSLPIDAESTNKALDSIRTKGLDNLTNGLTDAIMQSKKLGEVFHEISAQIISDLVRIAVQRAITIPLANAIFGGSDGGINGVNIMANMALAGARAGGGPVGSGKTYLVGENGPELFTPGMSGSITSNSALKNLAGGASRSGATLNQTVNINAQGSILSEEVWARIVAAKQQAIAQAIPVAVQVSRQIIPSDMARQQATRFR